MSQRIELVKLVATRIAERVAALSFCTSNRRGVKEPELRKHFDVAFRRCGATLERRFVCAVRAPRFGELAQLRIRASASSAIQAGSALLPPYAQGWAGASAAFLDLPVFPILAASRASRTPFFGRAADA